MSGRPTGVQWHRRLLAAAAADVDDDDARLLQR